MTILEILAILKTQYPQFEWTVPPDLKMGILTTNQAFKFKNVLVKKEENQAKEVLEKEEKSEVQFKSPVEYAQHLVKEIQAFCEEKNLGLVVKNLGPYVNLELQDEVWNSFLEEENLPLEEVLPKEKTKVILEYVGANVAKKLHAGHMRNLNIGDSLRRILKLKFPQLLTDNHWGDWGVNMGVLIWGWKANGDEEKYRQSPIEELNRVYVWANAQKEIVEDWENLVRQEFVKLEQKDAENYRLWQEFILVTKQYLQQDLDLMRVPPLDLEQGESFYEEDMHKLWAFLEKNQIWQSEGRARFFDFPELIEKTPGLEPQLKDKFKHFGRCYLVSSQGYTSYAFRDLAARLQWSRDLAANTMITITANEQIHHFKQAFGLLHCISLLPSFEAEFGKTVAEKLRWKNLIHISYGFLTLTGGKMSTRKGSVLTLKDLFSEVEAQAKETLLQKSATLSEEELTERSQKVSLAALKWYDLNRGIEEDLVLDIPAILKFEGNTGVYQLYTLVRLSSILEKF